MKLEVDEEDFKFWRADNKVVLPDLVREGWKFDMIFLDPPFFEWGGEVTSSKPDHNDLSYLAQKLLKDEGSLWLCGTQPQLVYDWKWWSRFFTLNFELIQSKNIGAPPTGQRKQFLRVHESIWCLYLNRAKYSDLKMSVDRITSEGELTDKGQTWRLWAEGAKPWRVNVGYPRSVYNVRKITTGHPEYVGHPTQKPEEIIADIVGFSTDPGDWVLDPYCGSGTVPAMSIRLGRKCYAIEIEEEYTKMIIDRVGRARAEVIRAPEIKKQVKLV